MKSETSKKIQLEGSEEVPKKDVRLLVSRIWQRAYMDTEDQHQQWIEEYVAQELAAAKESLKELLPIAERMHDSLWMSEKSGDKKMISQWKSAIEKAKKLI